MSGVSNVAWLKRLTWIIRTSGCGRNVPRAATLSEFGGKMLGFRRHGKLLGRTWGVAPRRAALPKLQRRKPAQGAGRRSQAGVLRHHRLDLREALIGQASAEL